MNKSTYIIPLVIIGCLLYLYFFRQEEVGPVEVVVAEEKKETPVYIVEASKKEDGYLTDWNTWGECSKECGGGSQQRERSYVPAQNGGVDIDEAERIKLIENRNCNEQGCPEDGVFSSWSEWGECNKSCGGGIQYRNRIYTPAKNGGVELEDKDNTLESRECNVQNCPENGYHTEWSNWEACSKECNGGIQSRKREYISSKYGGLDLENKDNLLESRYCNEQNCPENGYHSDWNEWSKCNKECGGGTQKRERSYTPAKYGGVDLSEAERINLIENRNCNEQNCPVDGYLTEWNNWSNCNKECGGGTQSRNRTYNPAKYGGVDLDEAERIKLIENRNCNEQNCPINGYLTEWSNWSNCDKECEGGSQKRERIYVPAKFGGIDLSLDERNNIIEIRKCNEQACPVNGKFSEWSNWSNCDKTCGDGTQSRSRTYTPATNGGVDLVDRNNLLETKSCNIQACPVAYNFILTTNKYTFTPLSVTSPNGLYKFEWNNTPDLILYKLINGSWNIASKIILWNSNNTSLLSCGTEGVATYNSTYTSSSILGTVSNINGSIKGFAIDDNGQLVIIDYLGSIGLVILSPSSPYLVK